MKKSFLQRIAAGIANRAAKYAGIPLRDPALVALLGRQPSTSGVDVDEATAMTYSAVWAAHSLIGGSVASLPVGVYERINGGLVESNCEQNTLLAITPNPEMTPFVFHETMQHHLLGWGNAYAKIERSGTVPVALWPLMPSQVEPERDDSGRLVYKFTAQDETEEDELIPASEIVHVPGLGYDGVRGYPVIQHMAESIGLGLAEQNAGASFFGRGSMPGGVIEHPMEMGAQAVKNLRETWEILHRGPGNSHRVAILEEGATYKQMSLSPEASQYIESRAFQVVEIARWYNIPPHMLRDLTNATFSNIEHQGIDFLTYTLRPWLIRWAQEYRRKLFPVGLQHRYTVGHNTHELLLTDAKTRFEQYQIGRLTGIFSLNDIFKRERMPLLPGPEGDVRLMPQNMAIFGSHSLPQTDETGAAITDPKAVQDAVLSGPQMANLLAVTQAVQVGTLKPEAAKHLLKLAMPSSDGTVIDALIASYSKGNP